MLKKFDEFDDCIHCEKHTKNIWNIVAVGKDRASIDLFEGISEDLEILYHNVVDGRPFEFNPIGNSGTNKSNTRGQFSDIFLFQICEVCKKVNIRDIQNNRLLYPAQTEVPKPNTDMPLNVKEVYNEAASIYNNSLRAGLALLRLGLELLCDQVGYNKGKLYHRIEKLAEDGVIDNDIKDIAHGVRGLGNDAIHTKQIGEKATLNEVKIVFELLNIITEELITKPKRKREFAEKYRK